VAFQESSERRQSLSNLSNHPRYFGYSLPLLKGRLWPYNENTSHQKLFSLTTTFPSGRDFLRTSVIRQNCDRPRNLNDLHPSSFFVERLGWLPCLCSLGLLKILPPLEPERSAHQQEPAWSRYPDWAGCITATAWRLRCRRIVHNPSRSARTFMSQLCELSVEPSARFSNKPGRCAAMRTCCAKPLPCLASSLAVRIARGFRFWRTTAVIHHFRKRYDGSLILNVGINLEHGARLISEGAGELVAFGRTYIANPDLVERIASGARLKGGRPEGYCGSSPVGYTEYPFVTAETPRLVPTTSQV